jgi:hypothetical protein
LGRIFILKLRREIRYIDTNEVQRRDLREQYTEEKRRIHKLISLSYLNIADVPRQAFGDC